MAISRLDIPRLCALLLLATPSVPVDAGSRRLTLDLLFSADPQVRIEFSGQPASGLVWASDSTRFLMDADRNDRFQPPVVRTVADQTARPLFEMGPVIESLASHPDFPEADARHLTDDQITLSPDWSALVIERAGDLFLHTLGAGVARRLTRAEGDHEVVSFSPDGRRLAFVRAGDLFAVDLGNEREIALAVNGDPDVLSGKLDWVYQEEIYGRGEFKGYWWSPDSRRIAFLELDQAAVGAITLVDQRPTGQAVEIMRYPKPGDPNPAARLGIVGTDGSRTVWVDTSLYADGDHLIVRVGWTPDAAKVFFLVQDRQQTWLDINLADPRTGAVSRLLRDRSPAFIDIDLTGSPHLLEDGSFLWKSGRSGYHHLYHFDPTGAVIRQLTNGEWEVRDLYGIDESSGWIYLSTTAASPIETQLYRIRLDGSRMERLSARAGHHTAIFSPDYAHYLDTWSDYETPPSTTLHRADGSRVGVVSENRVAALEDFQLPAAEFLRVRAPDGFLLEAALLRPPDFDPSHRYPVVQYNYGGPHAPTVLDRWGGQRHMWLRFLAQEGFVVWLCDNRSASGKGIKPTWEVHGRLGEVELADIETCVDWLGRQDWVDRDRLGLYGSSYGGFLSAYALTHSRAFQAAIAFAPVTDWRFYDSIYTERYMGLPDSNPDGYRSSSVVEAAANLQGHLLLIHGTMDNNVHPQNTLALVAALQRAGKEFTMMLYPTARHSVEDRAQVLHLYTLMTRFLKEHL